MRRSSIGVRQSFPLPYGYAPRVFLGRKLERVAHNLAPLRPAELYVACREPNLVLGTELISVTELSGETVGLPRASDLSDLWSRYLEIRRSS
jgi:hypothetical protein